MKDIFPDWLKEIRLSDIVIFVKITKEVREAVVTRTDGTLLYSMSVTR